MKLFIALMSLTLVFPNISCTEKKTNHLGEILFFAGINASTQKRSGGNIAATSSDGITWTNQSLPSSQIWSSVAYGNGTYVAVTGFKIPYWKKIVFNLFLRKIIACPNFLFNETLTYESSDKAWYSFKKWETECGNYSV